MTRRRVPSIPDLRIVAQGPKSHRTEWHYRIHRKVSIYITWLLLHTPLTANQVSLLGLALGLAGTGLLLTGSSARALLGLGCFYGYFLLDKVDGEIARCREQQSLRGICLDYIGHLVIPPLVPLAVGGFIAGQAQSDLYWLAGSAAALAMMFQRAARDIPGSIILHKSAADSHVLQQATPAMRRASGSPRPRATGVLRRGFHSLRFLATFWPTVTLLGLAVAIQWFHEPWFVLLSTTFLLVCSLHFARALLTAYQLFRSIEKRIAHCLQELRRVSEHESRDI